MITLSRISLLLLTSLFLNLTLAGESEKKEKPEAEKPATLAVFILNRAGTEFADRVQAFEDRIIGTVTSEKLSLVSREDVLKSIKPNEVDEAFETQTSAVRLAQNLGVDYLLLVSILSMDRDQKVFEGYGVSTKNEVYSLDTAYRLTSLVKGGSLLADTITVQETTRQTENLTESTGNMGNKLLSRAATEIGARVRKATVGGLPIPEKTPGQVPVYLAATIQDLNIPDVVKGEDGKYRITANTYQLEVFGANVEINGLSVGTTSQTDPLMVPAGINRIRISRPGYESIERNANFVANQRLTFPMRMDAQGMARMQEIIKIFQQMKRDAALTEAEVEVLQGHATYLKQSGVRLDHRSDVKSDVKVDADKLPDIQEIRNSLFP